MATLEGSLDAWRRKGVDRRRLPPSRSRPSTNTPSGAFPGDGRAGPRSTSRPATSSRWCCRSASRRRSTCRPSRSTGRCAVSIRHRSSAHLDFGGFQIVCSSPEILVRVRDGAVTIRPIAGTRWRGKTREAEDEALAADLLADEKECAEHLMLLDLGRNDVGRVAEIGHGERDRALRHRALQPRYAHRVERRGAARSPRMTRSTRLAAGFPAGTVSGAPKGAGDGDHRRTGDRQARHLRRVHRLFRRGGRDGHLHRAAHGGGEGRA